MKFNELEWDKEGIAYCFDKSVGKPRRIFSRNHGFDFYVPGYMGPQDKEGLDLFTFACLLVNCEPATENDWRTADDEIRLGRRKARSE